MSIELTGEERIIIHGEKSDFSVLKFWQYAMSDIITNTNRGTFAEFVVRSAMEYGGFVYPKHDKSGWEPFDLYGPIIPSLGREAHIEVKSAAIVQRWTPDSAEPILEYKPSNVKFSIAPAVMPTETGDYPHGAEKHRNNDLYVFCFYTASRKTDNILDMKYWKFYVCPTTMLKEPMISDTQKTISLAKLNKLGIEPCSFEKLYPAVLAVISQMSE